MNVFQKQKSCQAIFRRQVPAINSLFFCLFSVLTNKNAHIYERGQMFMLKFNKKNEYKTSVERFLVSKNKKIYNA
jgi:hypothetical protein